MVASHLTLSHGFRVGLRLAPLHAEGEFKLRRSAVKEVMVWLLPTTPAPERGSNPNLQETVTFRPVPAPTLGTSALGVFAPSPVVAELKLELLHVKPASVTPWQTPIALRSPQ